MIDYRSLPCSWTPSINAPKCFRDPECSVMPPMTASCCAGRGSRLISLIPVIRRKADAGVKWVPRLPFAAALNSILQPLPLWGRCLFCYAKQTSRQKANPRQTPSRQTRPEECCPEEACLRREQPSSRNIAPNVRNSPPMHC